MNAEKQLIDDVWSVIHDIENAVGRDGLRDMDRIKLENLVLDVYDKLGAIVQ